MTLQIAGNSASSDVKSFLKVFGSLAQKGDDAKELRRVEWWDADKTRTGRLSLDAVNRWIQSKLAKAFGTKRGSTLWKNYQVIYGYAFQSAMEVPNRNPSDLLCPAEFRLLNAYLCIYALAMDAFVSIFENPSIISVTEERKLNRTDWMDGHQRAAKHGFVALTNASDNALIIFDELDTNNDGCVSLAQWFHFLKENEISCGTPIGWLIHVGGSIPAKATTPERKERTKSADTFGSDFLETLQQARFASEHEQERITFVSTSSFDSVESSQCIPSQPQATKIHDSQEPKQLLLSSLSDSLSPQPCVGGVVESKSSSQIDSKNQCSNAALQIDWTIGFSDQPAIASSEEDGNRSDHAQTDTIGEIIFKPAHRNAATGATFDFGSSVIAGPGASSDAIDFLKCFLLLAHTGNVSAMARAMEWRSAAGSSTSPLTLPRMGEWIERRLCSIYGEKRGIYLYNKYFPVYTRAFYSLKNLPGTAEPDCVCRSEFRLMIAHLCIATLALDAFLRLNHDSKEKVHMSTWLNMYHHCSRHGFISLANISKDTETMQSAIDLFGRIDKRDRGFIRLTEWIDYLIKDEIVSQTAIGQLLEGSKNVPASLVESSSDEHVAEQKLEASSPGLKVNVSNTSSGKMAISHRAETHPEHNVVTEKDRNVSHCQSNALNDCIPENLMEHTFHCTTKLKESSIPERSLPRTPLRAGTMPHAKMAGKSASEAVKDFIDVFLPLAEKTSSSKCMRQKEWLNADERKVGSLDLAAVTRWIQRKLVSAYKHKHGVALTQRFSPVYLFSYRSAKQTQVSSVHTPPASGDITLREFRLLNAYLCVYALAFDAFDTYDRRKGNADCGELWKSFSRTEWVLHCGNVAKHGFIELARVDHQQLLLDFFSSLCDSKGETKVRFSEWCAFLCEKEVAESSYMGSLLTIIVHENTGTATKGDSTKDYYSNIAEHRARSTRHSQSKANLNLMMGKTAIYIGDVDEVVSR